MNFPAPPFKLNAEERQSATWRRIKAHLEHELDVARKRNDSDLAFSETARVRGRIAFIKQLLAAGEDSVTGIAE